MDSRDFRGLMEAYAKVCAPVDEAVYGGEPKKPEDTRMVVTAADKKGNTPAYQKFKAGHKGYKAADHLGEESVDEGTGHGSRRSFKTQSAEERRRVSMYGKNYEPHKNYDPEANRGQGQILRPNQAEKQRRKELAKSAMGEEYVDEAVKGASPHAMEMRKGDAADRRKGIKPLSAKKGEEYAKYKMSQMAHSERKRMGEELDTFDAILEYLVAEGYAATNKEALVIMANMSEEWRTEIIESQYARENPEKYEREQAKKTSKKEKAMNDPHTGINSPAFEKFMRQQMGR